MASRPYIHHGLLWRAILMSLLIHAIMLFPPGVTDESRQSPAPHFLTALLRPVAEQDPVKSSTAIRKGLGPPVGHQSKFDKEIGSVIANDQPTSRTEVPSSEAGSAPLNGPREVTNVTRGQENAVSIVAGGVDLDVGGVKNAYLRAIAAEAGRVKKYPQRAFAAGWTGTAEIHIAVAKGGIVKPPQLAKSSGHAEIDEAALMFVGVALKRTPVPDILRTSDIELTLPVTFSIYDE